MNHRLNIFCNENLVGHLEIELQNNTAKLIYDEEWVKNGFELSPHLKFDKEISSQSIKRFIANLLPEGEGLEFVSRFFKISKANQFGLIEAIGSESAGALTFTNSTTLKTSFREILKDELSRRIALRKEYNITLWDEKPRLSIAGVQDKLPILIIDDRYGIGEGEISSTHILKFDKKENHHLVLNEYFCMQLARTCGIKVADVALEKFDDESVLVVQRFDREIRKEKDTSFKVVKKHIIDGCQMLDLDVIMKYQKPYGGANPVELGVSFKKLYEGVDFCRTKALAKLEILRWSFFNLLIHNYDAHAKNISFFVSKNGIEVAPFYDIVNIAMYENIQNEFAMSYGEEFVTNDIKTYDMVSFCKNIGINQRLFKEEFLTIIKNIEKNIYNLQSEISKTLAQEEQDFLTKLIKNIVDNLPKYKSIANEFTEAYGEYKNNC